MKTLNQPIKIIASKVVAVIALLTLMCPLCSYADDTAALQQQLNAGDVTLPANAVYSITGLTVTHNFNLNGSKLNLTSTGGAALHINAPNITVTNGKLYGTWAVTSPSNPTGGTSGITLSNNSNNVTISKIVICNMSSYGIVSGPVNKLYVTSCAIEKTGYIAFFYDAESAPTTTGGRFTYNTIDRSTVPASNISQLAVAIRGGSTNAISGWTISNNKITMPKLPKDWSAACMEVRFINNSTVTKNIFTSGSMGLSLVRATNVTVSLNKTLNSQLEGIEFADSFNSKTSNNSINGSAQAGILLDGSTGCSGITLTGDTVKNTTQDCIHAYKNSSNITISGCVLTAQTYGVNIQNSNNIKVTNTSMDGHGVGTVGIVLDTCPGSLTVSGGSMKNFTRGPITVYNVTSGLVTDNITMTGTVISNMPAKLISNVSNGAKLGANVVIN